MELASSTVAVAFCNGIAKALRRYYECRHQLREKEEYQMYWLNFVALTFEFGQIAQEGMHKIQYSLGLFQSCQYRECSAIDLRHFFLFNE
jgi:hypothetical protein